MAWLDERIWCHPKVTDLNDKAFRVYINSIAYSSGMHTKGRLSLQQQRLLGSSRSVMEQLVDAGLWDGPGGDGSVEIHDWEHYNADRDAKRAADRKRKRDQRDRERDNGRDTDREFRVLKSEG